MSPTSDSVVPHVGFRLLQWTASTSSCVNLFLSSYHHHHYHHHLTARDCRREILPYGYFACFRCWIRSPSASIFIAFAVPTNLIATVPNRIVTSGNSHRHLQHLLRPRTAVSGRHLRSSHRQRRPSHTGCFCFLLHTL